MRKADFDAVASQCEDQGRRSSQTKLGIQDSNLKYLIQSQACYRYTNPQGAGYGRPAGRASQGRFGGRGVPGAVINRFWERGKGGRVKAQRWPGFRDETTGPSHRSDPATPLLDNVSCARACRPVQGADPGSFAFLQLARLETDY